MATAKDPYANEEHGLLSPSGHAEAVSPSDTTDLTFVTRALYIGAAGNVTVTMLAGEDVQFFAVPVGATLNVRCTRVKATGTSATHIVALY